MSETTLTRERWKKIAEKHANPYSGVDGVRNAVRNDILSAIRESHTESDRELDDLRAENERLKEAVNANADITDSISRASLQVEKELRAEVERLRKLWIRLITRLAHEPYFDPDAMTELKKLQPKPEETK